jgi:hypothetical protein
MVQHGTEAARSRAVMKLAALLVLSVAASAFVPHQPIRTSYGLDHIPIAVNDLAAAAQHYRALGFVLKPGRPHANGITNQHVKFPDGTELELITAGEARDALTARYRRHLASGDGPAFLAFFAPPGVQIPRPLHPSLAYVFFGGRNASPTDRPEHFAHENTADSFIEVWISGAALEQERLLLSKLGAKFVRRKVHVPDAVTADVAQLKDGEVVFLPASRQSLKNRPIVGAAVRVKRIEDARLIVARAGVRAIQGSGDSESSLFLPPNVAHGLWLELREVRSAHSGGS